MSATPWSRVVPATLAGVALAAIAVPALTLDSSTARAAPTESLQNPLTYDFTCEACHTYDNNPMAMDLPPHAPGAYAGTVMANAARDPVFWAGVAIAYQDQEAPGETEECVRCHAPHAFVEGRGDALALADLEPVDRSGVDCDLCHRLIDDGEHLYTSGTHPYFRAPHFYIALATRFQPDRAAATDILLMTSRGGNHFDRTFMEAFIPPGLDSLEWANRANYAAVGVIPTSEAEMSVYVRGRRYVLRTDGFASARAGYNMGTLTTKPFRFDGNVLELNVATSASGLVKVEVLDESGAPIDGFTLEDAEAIFANAIRHRVSWNGSTDVGALSGRTVKLRFTMQDADLYSFRFVSASS